VLRHTGAHVVLSSAWRYIVHRGEATLMGMEWLLRSHGMIANRLAGITRPDTMIRPPYSGKPIDWPLENERGQQITDWLREHAPRGHGYDAGHNYAVVDDLDLGITAAGHPFVMTDGTAGIVETDVRKLIELLGRKS
jgi:hypothetical protein